MLGWAVWYPKHGALVGGTGMDVGLRRAPRKAVELEQLGRIPWRCLDASPFDFVCIVDAAAEAIVVAAPDGTIRDVNPAFEVQTGYAREEVVGVETAAQAAVLRALGFAEAQGFFVAWPMDPRDVASALSAGAPPRER